jgi:hypothetical protein
MDAIELQTKTNVSTAREMEGKSTMDREERDRAHLLRLGKRPLLKVPLTTYEMRCILFCLPAYAMISERMASWLSWVSQPPSLSPGRAFC